MGFTILWFSFCYFVGLCLCMHRVYFPERPQIFKPLGKPLISPSGARLEARLRQVPGRLPRGAFGAARSEEGNLLLVLRRE